MCVSQSDQLTQRVAYVVTYKSKQLLKRLNHLPVSISYHYEASQQVLIYFDKNNLKFIQTQLEKARGFVEMEESALFQEEIYNF